jgi:hypothetical protein
MRCLRFFRGVAQDRKQSGVYLLCEPTVLFHIESLAGLQTMQRTDTFRLWHSRYWENAQMDRHLTASGLSPDKLAQLWNIGSETDRAEPEVDQDSKKTELLRDLLAGTLPAQLDKGKARSTEKTHLQSVVSSIADKPIERLIQNSGTDVALLRRVKDHGKRLSDNAESKAQYHVANTVYYAAIASALVFHDKRITKFSYKDLGKYFRRLDKEKWIPEALRGLLSRAAEYCQMRQSRL